MKDLKDTSTFPAFRGPVAGAVTGVPRAILRLEGGVLMAAAMTAYAFNGGSWLLFALLFLLPDVFMLGYLIDRRRGAALYNLGHTTALPALLIATGLIASSPLAISIGLVWLAHIGFDRIMGYGLKYAVGFHSTHL